MSQSVSSVLDQELDVKTIFRRAATLLQRIWLQYREQLFSRKIEGFTKSNGREDLQIVQAVRPMSISPFENIHPFPRDLGIDHQDKNRILNAMACADAVEYLTPTVILLLAGK